MSADPLEPDCVCGHDHYASMSADREMWTSTCPYCPCENFRAASPVPVGTPAPTTSIEMCRVCGHDKDAHHLWNDGQWDHCVACCTGSGRCRHRYGAENPIVPESTCAVCFLGPDAVVHHYREAARYHEFDPCSPVGTPETGCTQWGGTGTGCPDCAPPAPTSETPDAVQAFAAMMLRQYDRLVATKQNTVTGTLLVVQDYEMERLRAASPAPAATPPACPECNDTGRKAGARCVRCTGNPTIGAAPSQPSEPTRAEKLYALAGKLEAENEVLRLQARLSAVTAEKDRLREAAEALLAHYVQLVMCGDCGNWNAEDEPQVKAMRAALTEPDNA